MQVGYVFAIGAQRRPFRPADPSSIGLSFPLVRNAPSSNHRRGGGGRDRDHMARAQLGTSLGPLSGPTTAISMNTFMRFLFFRHLIFRACMRAPGCWKR